LPIPAGCFYDHGFPVHLHHSGIKFPFQKSFNGIKKIEKIAFFS